MKVSRDFLRLYIIPAVLLLGILLTAFFTVYYTATIKTQNGKVVAANWPKAFTFAFADYISPDPLRVSEDGLTLLRENGLWLQVLSEDGSDVYHYAKPATSPDRYRPYELLQAFQSGDGQSSVFVGFIKAKHETYTYLIGFPFSVSKVTMVVDNRRFGWGKRLIFLTVILTAAVILALTIYYNALIVGSLRDIRASLRAVSERSYAPARHKRFLRDVYDGIDALQRDMLAADHARKQDERAREEWLSNITHDLKTPLSPIRGYAELLAEGSDETAGRYGAIILKNALYTEQLVDDLKLTYQLRSGMLPINRQPQNVTRFVREIVIDLLNTPEYAGRNLSFETDTETATCAFDARLFRRAIVNIIANALKHNPPDTHVTVRVSGRNDGSIQVSDDGKGMTQADLNGLFTRYYRGTNTRDNVEGTGLGMAIARQIVQAHGYDINATSAQGIGTSIIITLRDG